MRLLNPPYTRQVKVIIGVQEWPTLSMTTINGFEYPHFKKHTGSNVVFCSFDCHVRKRQILSCSVIYILHLPPFSCSFPSRQKERKRRHQRPSNNANKTLNKSPYKTQGENPESTAITETALSHSRYHSYSPFHSHHSGLEEKSQPISCLYSVSCAAEKKSQDRGKGRKENKATSRRSLSIAPSTFDPTQISFGRDSRPILVEWPIAVLSKDKKSRVFRAMKEEPKR